MAKKTLTQSTVATNNIQSQPDQVKDQAAALKLAFDQYGIDSKQYNNTVLLVELADESVSNSGSNTIGHNSVTVTADNVGDALEENAQAIAGVVLGQIPDNTLTEAKMAAEMKKQAGGVYPYDDGDANADAITDINAKGTTVDVTATGDILLTYANRFLNCTNAGAITLTIQPNSTIALPLYTEIAIKLKGSGSIIFAEGAGVTIDSIDGALTLATQYATAALHQTELNVWTLSGLLE